MIKNSFFSSGVLVIVLALFFTCLAAEEATDTQGKSEDKLEEGYLFFLQVENKKMPPNGKIDLLVVFKNTGTNEAHPGSSTFLGNCEFKVHLPNGEIAPLSLYGKQWFHPLKRGRQGGSYLFSLKPSEEIKASFDNLNRIYDMTLSGTYKVSASIQVPKRDGNKGNVTLTSNTIEVIIDENAEIDTALAEEKPKAN